MCGIMGYVGEKEAGPIVLEGLRLLESRGYDSAGIASKDLLGPIKVQKAKGKLSNLLERVKTDPCTGTMAIGHTRWATHGKAEDYNAHPHMANGVAVVHNGIIENYRELRKFLEEDLGRVFLSDTDTEVVPHLIGYYLQKYVPPTAIRKAVAHLKGTFALGIMLESSPAVLFAVRKNQPLIIGFGASGTCISSSEIALASFAEVGVMHLEDGDIAQVHAEGASVFDFLGNEIKREIRKISVSGGTPDKGNYKHFLLKETFDQPESVGDTFRSFSDSQSHEIVLPELPFDFKEINRLSIIGCGTAYHAGLIGKYWLESLAGLSADCEIASEFCYRDPVLSPNSAGLFLSQSGETRDTIAALEHMREWGIPSLAIVNAPASSLSRVAGGTLYTKAYPEIAVASTKAFTAQLAVLASLAVFAAKERGRKFDQAGVLSDFAELPNHMQEVLAKSEEIHEISKLIARSSSVFYIGRGTSYPLALEGALKLKEISYIHAEGYPAGELKHGPLALIDTNTTTVVIAPSDRHFDKTVSNLEEIITRGGNIVLISDERCCAQVTKPVARIALPEVNPFVSPFVYVVALQLLAYHTAVLKGTDVDQPRNLAKSVTVE
jgi:glucosamine--fructose-6-phosphate aminotransferase (isomerizing)